MQACVLRLDDATVVSLLEGTSAGTFLAHGMSEQSMVNAEMPSQGVTPWRENHWKSESKCWSSRCDP
jgi:hypothetical protein